MSYGLLWVEGLAIAWLWVAMWAAVAARLRRRRRAGVLLFLAVAAMVLFFGSFVAVSAQLKFGAGLEENWFAYCLSLFIACLIGAIVILVRAARRPDPGMPRAAASWPAGRLALGLAAVIAIDTMTLWNMDLAVRAEAANLRTEAGALLLSVAPPQVEDDRNAAVLYEKAFARMQADKTLSDAGSPLEADRPDLRGPSVAQLLARHAATLRLLREATAMPVCRFEHDYARPSITMLLPELSRIRSAGRLLSLDARHASATGDSGTAIAEVNALFRLARAAGSEPIIVSQLVGIALDGLGIEVLEDVLPHVRQSGELGELHIGDPASVARSTRRSLQGEEAFGLSVFSDLAAGRLTVQQLVGSMEGQAGADVAALPPLSLLMRVFVMPSDVRAYQQYIESCQAKAEGPFVRTTDQDREAARSAAGHGLLTTIIMPALDRFLLQAAEGQALHAAAWTGLAADRYRLDHGSFPASLDALVPQYLDDVPIDPFDGGPLKLSVRGDECLIYSIGPDRKDDGGAPFDHQKKTGDLVFTIRSSAAPVSAPSTSPASRQ
ncbi:MAG TPA: hypothetical protein VGI81_02640 [Tepidisphaeraceae bacterium]|jgi:hypothetical protein